MEVGNIYSCSVFLYHVGNYLVVCIISKTHKIIKHLIIWYCCLWWVISSLCLYQCYILDEKQARFLRWWLSSSYSDDGDALISLYFKIFCFLFLAKCQSFMQTVQSLSHCIHRRDLRSLPCTWAGYYSAEPRCNDCICDVVKVGWPLEPCHS
jgi:hypothetical protein